MTLTQSRTVLGDAGERKVQLPGRRKRSRMVLDLAKTCERVSIPVVLAWATHFKLPRKISRVLCGYFEHQRRVQFKGCAVEPLQTITATISGSKWSCLPLRIVLQDALSEVTKHHPHLNDITALLAHRTKNEMQQLSLFGRVMAEGNEKADELACKRRSAHGWTN